MAITRPEFENYDERIANAFLDASKAVPGLQSYLGITIDEVAPGYLKASMAVRDDLITPLGSLHGGAMAAFVDHVLGCVLYPLMKPGAWAATTEFKLNYLASVKRGVLVAESEVLSMTKRTAVVRVDVTNDGRPACVAQGTLLVVEPKTGQTPR